MAVTITKLAGGSVQPGIGVEYIFTLLLDDSWLAIGENLDLTSYFTQIISAKPESSDAVGDHAYKFDVIHPQSTDIAATTVKLTAYYSTDAAGAFTAVPDATDLSAVGQLKLRVIGTQAIPTSWA